jgi:hypothetical protein
MKSFPTYTAALTHATELAASCNRDCGIAKANEFGRTVFNVRLLPNPENRVGAELTMEVVHPGDPAPAVSQANPEQGQQGGAEACAAAALPLSDETRLVSAAGRFDQAIPVYDDGFGQLFIHRDSMGVSGIVRAQTWEDAYSICEDEFFPEASDTVEEMIAEYGEDFTEDDCWQEAFGFRPNGRRSMENGEDRDPIGHGIYAKDLNGDALDLLTPALLAELEITLEITPW